MSFISVGIVLVKHTICISDKILIFAAGKETSGGDGSGGKVWERMADFCSGCLECEN